MPEAINWLHISDLHFGLDRDAWLWPKVKHDVFRDIERLGSENGSWDLVFFTGDVVQAGKEEEFKAINAELEELWEVLKKVGDAPKIAVIPGNHDLVRLPSGSAIAKTLSQLWWTDPEVRSEFWKNPKSEYRVAVEECFTNFLNWKAHLSIPLCEAESGILPGDFSAIVTKGSIKLGIVGLNTTFLQLTSADAKGKLDLHVSQLHAVCNNDPEAWIGRQTATVLLTHQPPTWFAPETLRHFRQEIAPAGRFLFHLCGHQHEPEAFEISEAGAAPRRLRQAPSLFGLDNWKEIEPKVRTHGYNAGQFVFEGAGGFEKLWPRTAVSGRHGGRKICPDHGYDLNEEDCIVTQFDLEAAEPLRPSANTSGKESYTSSAREASETTAPPVELLTTSPDEAAARAKLIACPRLLLTCPPHHRNIRQFEQSQIEHELRQTRSVWLAADWGSSSEEFLAASILRFQPGNQLPDAFHLRCDEAQNVDAFEALFPQQFGMPLQSFCAVAAPLTATFLLVDGIHPALCTKSNLQRLRSIASAVTDYCPYLRLVFISRLRPDTDAFPVIELHPLDGPDVRTYLAFHSDATPDLQEPEVIERLHELSDGIPAHLDRLLKALKVSSLAAILESNIERRPTSVDDDTTPKALIASVAALSTSRDKRSKRSLRLLKVLSVLQYGETLESIRHYLPTEPFFEENALQLHEMGLLDVVPLLHATAKVSTEASSTADHSAPKILKISRQVRDYVLRFLPPRERQEIVAAGLERFFGRGWREGRVKLRTPPAGYAVYLDSGAGNEFALLSNVIADGKSSDDDASLRRAATAAVYYSRHLKTKERFRDLVIVAGTFAHAIDQDMCPKEWAVISCLYAQALRMTGKRRDAIMHARAALDCGDQLGTEDTIRTWLDIALAEESLGNKDQAIAAANEVKSRADAKSSSYRHAVTIIADATLKGEERTKELTELERQARNDEHVTVANNIALDLARETEDPAEKVTHFDRVLASNDTKYNQIRAIVGKAIAVLTLDPPQRLKPSETYLLAGAYSYLYAQRFGSLFDQCHEALWREFESTEQTDQLLRLFRHSSFLWRIRGNESKEADYLQRLADKEVQHKAQGTRGFVIEVRYFIQRMTLILSSVAK